MERHFRVHPTDGRLHFAVAAAAAAVLFSLVFHSLIDRRH